MKDCEKIVMVGNEKVIIDLSDLIFSDATLQDFLMKIGSRIDYVGRAYADAQREVLRCEQIQENCYLACYKYFKEQKQSDKTADLYAKAEPTVQNAKTKYIEARHSKDVLYNHLQALNVAREDAHQRGHFIRKEMEKLGSDIYYPDNHSRQEINDIIGES